MKNTVLVGLFTLSAALPAAAQSVPTKGPACANQIKTNAVAEGAGIYFDQNCQIAYVLPPVHGRTHIDSIAGTTNLAECVEIDDLNATLGNIQARFRILTAKLNPAAAGPSMGGPTGSGPFGRAPAPPPVVVSQPLTPQDLAEMKELQDELGQFRTLRLTYNGIEAATAHFVYDLDQQGLVKRYQQANPGIHFEPMPLQRAYLSFNHKDGSGAPDASAVISMSVPGLGRLPDSPDPTLLDVAPPQVSRAPDTLDAADTRVFSASLSGVMRLSLIGACPFYDQQSKSMPSALNESDLRAHLAANVQYAYALQAFRKYHAEYNLGMYVSKLLQSSTSGGFLSTKTVTSYVETTKDDDWFKLSSESNDPRFFYPYLAQEIKANLTDRVLKQITLSKFGGPTATNGLTDPPANGVSAAAAGLHKCPNLYCQAGAFALDVVNAAFGSSSATNSFISANNYFASDDVTEKVMLEFYGSGGFIAGSETN